ncbi:sensor histidine kinase [Neorhizobium galegae]|uniref:sensor histidine kinase n=1 Tax=Neorhizobium galegae TaxID=399 RepID=UPI000621E8DC|nr:histidine kinase dimerization/phosphoacceptor domain -containing protein [Neorhizobium galegae]CDZ28263.1 Sensory transduction regulatory protein [Neorhizobium galegae bv. officinalis]KAA9388043.1 histidine kinase [Neorhizobium galegae]KAB1115493.1 histidine kinase [Neorhizobium galegae]MCM2500486.1 ATP-binding protein [Neorhizobium galegae]MCQ1773396.1 ATP-binding protein [Neorhizobium galegae]
MSIAAPLPPTGAMSLGIAIVSTSAAPLLLLDGALMVLAGSSSFCREFEIDPATVSNRPFSDLGDGEWNVRSLLSLLEATASGSADVHAYEMDLKRKDRPSRQLVLSAQKLDYGDVEGVRVLLSIADVTDVRLAEKLRDDLLREKEILLREVQHRVANSLQIIASILLQSARRVQSEETRSHLTLAHGRVMSIAAVQRQLAAANAGDVELRTYFTQLCKSLAASMIFDPEEISIKVNVDDSVASANVSASLGLIVTELVINALKHAFPDQRNGKIVVDYHSDNGAWSLSVGDDGVGIPDDPAHSQPGLGTGIVEAMAKQLDARFILQSLNPGTKAEIMHA